MSGALFTGDPGGAGFFLPENFRRASIRFRFDLPYFNFTTNCTLAEASCRTGGEPIDLDIVFPTWFFGLPLEAKELSKVETSVLEGRRLSFP